MDRTNYLNLCKECAMICNEGLYGMKIDVPEHLQVEYQGRKYYPDAYELSFKKDGSVRHIAVLHALTANSICSAPLQDIK